MAGIRSLLIVCHAYIQHRWKALKGKNVTVLRCPTKQSFQVGTLLRFVATMDIFLSSSFPPVYCYLSRSLKRFSPPPCHGEIRRLSTAVLSRVLVLAAYLCCAVCISFVDLQYKQQPICIYNRRWQARFENPHVSHGVNLQEAKWRRGY